MRSFFRALVVFAVFSSIKFRFFSNLLLQIQQYSRNIDELKSQLGLSQEKLRKEAQESTRRDEEMVILKVELATLQEKHRLTQDEVSKSRALLVFPFSHDKRV